MQFGLVGKREVLDGLSGGALSNPHKDTPISWKYYIPKTGAPHGDSPTICSNLVLKWLRQNAKYCEFILYALPRIGVGAKFYKEVKTDSDFIEPHNSVRELRKHQEFQENSYLKYKSYIFYLLKEFPDLYLLPIEDYLANADYQQLLLDFPERVINPEIFDNVRERTSSEQLLNLILPNLPQDKQAYIHLARTKILKDIEKQVRGLVTDHYQAPLLSKLGLQYDQEIKPFSPFVQQKTIITTQFSSNFFQIAIRLLISLRTLGSYLGPIHLLLYEEWEKWQLKTLEKLGCTFDIYKDFDKKAFMVQRFIDLIKPLKKYTDHKLIHLDSDIWVQDRISSIFTYAEVPSFGVWSGASHFIKRKGLQEYTEKYLKILEKTTSINPEPGFKTSKGGIPHGGFHAGPVNDFLNYYSQIKEYLKRELIYYNYSEDEIGFFLACNEKHDQFDLNQFWTSYPSKIDLVTRKIEDENGLIKPILHFEKKQKYSNIIDFLIVHPTITAECIERLGLTELKENLFTLY